MTLLWIAHVWPEPASSGAGTRTVQLLSAAALLGHDVHVASACQSNSHRTALEAEGYTTHTVLPNDSSFDALVRTLEPKVVVFDRFMIEEQFGWRVREQCPKALRILDTIDLHFLRREREEMCRAPRDPDSLPSTTLLRELAAIYRSDLSLIISSYEHKLLLSTFAIPSFLVAYCPMGAETDAGAGTEGFSSRTGCAFIGNFTHAPNLDAVNLLRSGLWGKIRLACKELGVDPALHIYGAYPPPAAASWSSTEENIIFEGTATDARTVLATHRLNLAPLRFGAGIKGKILDGWSVGLPSVATEVAAEGMCGPNGEFGGVIAPTLDDFPELVAKLYSNEASWNEARIRGSLVLRECFSLKEMQRRLRDALLASGSQRDEHRRKNLIGEMLWYHGNRSTEFMSRWIELKNSQK